MSGTAPEPGAKTSASQAEEQRQTGYDTEVFDVDEDGNLIDPPSAAKSSETDSRRFSLRLSPEAYAAVKKIQELGNMDTMQEAIRRAIGEELLLMTERRAGWKVLLQKGNRYREVIVPQI